MPNRAAVFIALAGTLAERAAGGGGSINSPTWAWRPVVCEALAARDRVHLTPVVVAPGGSIHSPTWAWRPVACVALAALDRVHLALVVVAHYDEIARTGAAADAASLPGGALRPRLRAEVGIALLDILSCPAASPTRNFRPCRHHAPAPCLLRCAARRRRLDLSRSRRVGDTPDDVEAGLHAGCRTVLLGGASGRASVGIPGRAPQADPRARCADWDDVVHLIVAQQPADFRPGPRDCVPGPALSRAAAPRIGAPARPMLAPGFVSGPYSTA